jgi:hypothetical protein
MDMLCYMHEGNPYGFLKVGSKVILPSNLAAMCGATLDEVKGLLAELKDADVFSIDDEGVMFSRRMVKDEKVRAARAAGGKLGGNPELIKGAKDNHKVNLKVKQKTTPSSSSSSSSSISTEKETLARKSTSVPPPDTPWPSSASERGGGMDLIMKRINSLRSEWQLPAQWNSSEMHALHGGSAAQICELSDADWDDLKAYMAAKNLPRDFWQPRSRLKFVETFSDVCASLQRWREKGNGTIKNNNQTLNPFI